MVSHITEEHCKLAEMRLEGGDGENIAASGIIEFKPGKTHA